MNLSATLPRRGSFELLAIGCSAGGVEALGQLLPQLQGKPGFAVAVVLHLIPGVDSTLIKLFGPRCTFEVREAQDKEPLRPQTIYFAPPNYHLSVEPEGSFSLSVEEPVLFCRPAIDILFESAAFAYRERSVGVLLSGSNSDGANGLAQIFDAGGTAIAQDPESASFPTMPRSAVELFGRSQRRLQVCSLMELSQWFAGLGEESPR